MQVAVALFEGFTALDAIGPYTVLANIPGNEVVTVATQPGQVHDDRSLLVRAATGFDEVSRPDMVVVPGGLVTRRMARDGHPLIDWITAVHPTTTWTTSVCTGAVLLGAAGVLDGLEATTHWYAADQLAAFGASFVSQRVVVQGKIVTAAGVSAGIDMALTLADLIGGPDLSQLIQVGIEYDPQPPFDAGSPDKAPAPLLELATTSLQAEETRLLDTRPRNRL